MILASEFNMQHGRTKQSVADEEMILTLSNVFLTVSDEQYVCLIQFKESRRVYQ
jgi:hypothetical protein